jgi:hypothetical protein
MNRSVQIEILNEICHLFKGLTGLCILYLMMIQCYSKLSLIQARIYGVDI